MVAGDMRHRPVGPGALPRHRLPRGVHPLPLILSRFLLVPIVRHLEARTAQAGHRLQNTAGADLPSEFTGSRQRMSGVVEVIRMRRIKETRGTLAGKIEGQAAPRKEGPRGEYRAVRSE